MFNLPLHKLQPFIELFQGVEKKLKYKGYTLFYSKGTSIVTRLIHTGKYEESVCNMLISSLQNVKQPVFIDIGSNVGLISLAVLKSIKDCRIYAFEPSPHPYKLFKRTII